LGPARFVIAREWCDGLRRSQEGLKFIDRRWSPERRDRVHRAGTGEKRFFIYSRKKKNYCGERKKNHGPHWAKTASTLSSILLKGKQFERGRGKGFEWEKMNLPLRTVPFPISRKRGKDRDFTTVSSKKSPSYSTLGESEKTSAFGGGSGPTDTSGLKKLRRAFLLTRGKEIALKRKVYPLLWRIHTKEGGHGKGSGKSVYTRVNERGAYSRRGGITQIL